LEFNPDANTPNIEVDDRQSIAGDMRGSRIGSSQANNQ